MTDIVDRLRFRADENYEMLANIHEPLLEAVDEIKRLRAENDGLRTALNADDQTLRLHMGEMTAQEMRTLRAGFKWVLARAALGGDK